MPRKARSINCSSYYHVIVQGYERQNIFKEEYLKKKYFDLLMDENQKFNITILTYCIMDNHAHLLLYCDEIMQMSSFMKNVNTRFAMYYNAQNSRVGYVFRDRFLSEAITNKKHLYACVPYIHMNPVVAQIVSKPEYYKYSSYNDFFTKSGIIDEDVLEKLFGSSKDYLELFKFLHLENGEGQDYISDIPKINIIEAKRIIESTLSKYEIDNFKIIDKREKIYILELLIEKGISIYQIGKVLKISYNTVKRMLNS